MPDDFFYNDDNIIDNDTGEPQNNGKKRGGIWSGAMSILRKNWFYGIILGFIFCVICAGAMALGLINSTWSYWLIYLTIPLILLPFFFATLASFNSIAVRGDGLRAGPFFGAFASYFSRQYRSTFSFWRSFLWYLVFYLVFAILLSFLGGLICQAIDSGTYNSMVDAYNAAEFSGSVSLAELRAIFTEGEYDMYMTYMAINALPPIIFGMGAFIYNIYKNSLSFFYRVNHPKTNPMTVGSIISITNRLSHGSYKADIWKIAGPAMGVWLVGYTATTILLIYFVPYFEEYYYLPSIIGMAGGFICLIFYMPFYYAGGLSFYNKWKDNYDTAQVEYNQMMYERMSAQAQYAEQQRRNMEEEMRRNGEYKDPDNPNNDDEDGSNPNSDSGNGSDYDDYGGYDS